MTSIASIPTVDIDNSGVFKYVLIKISRKNKEEGEKGKKGKDSHEKVLVRGFAWAGYHADIFDDVEEKLGKEWNCECLGGGRIQRSENGKQIKVYGYSVGFGKADHELTVSLLKKNWSKAEITWSNEGY